MPSINAILEINGQRYESHSGNWLAENQASKTMRSIDGMVTPAGAHYDGLQAVPKEEVLHNIVNKPTMNDVVRSGANHLNKKPQPSMILMRTVVKKPTPQSITVIRSQTAISKVPAKKPAHQLQTKLSVANMNHMRARRADGVTKSQKVEKFTKQAPVTNHQTPETLTPTATQLTPAVHHKNQHHTPRHRTTTDIFEDALAHAKGHHESPHHPKKKRAHKRAGVVAASIAAFVVVSGVAVTQNMDNLKMYMASSRAGFAASLPGYQPAGYHVNNVNSSAGVVATQYLSNTDARAYTVTQKPSKWDSQTLLSEYVKPNSMGSTNYYSVEKNGKTIYIFGDRNATWVSEGVWYEVKATDDLSDRQLIDISASL